MTEKVIVILLVGLMAATAASAATYSWEDQNGTLNFTEDYGSIPKKYRKKAKLLGADEQEQEPARIEKEEKKNVKSPQAGDKRSEKAQSEQRRDNAEYGGKTGSAWKSQFGKLDADIRAAEEQVEELRGRLRNTASMSRTEYLSLQAGIKNVELRIKALRRKKDELTDDANRSELPDEYR